jgi:hypothetical protein
MRLPRIGHRFTKTVMVRLMPTGDEVEEQPATVRAKIERFVHLSAQLTSLHLNAASLID